MKSKSITFKAREKSLYYMEDRTIKQPDLQGKRRRKNVLNLLNSKLLKKFVEKYPEYKNLSFQEFEEIIYVFNRVLWEEVLDNPEGIELPENLGEVYIASVKRKTERMDMKKSLSIGKPVYHRNLHTDGNVCNIIYSNKKHKYNFANGDVLRFNAHRDFKRTASKVYSEDWMKYRMFNERNDTSYAFKKQQRMEEAIKHKKEDYTNYNEFEL